MPARPRDADLAASGSTTSATDEAIERLESIGYAAGSREAAAHGVTRHDAARCQPGLNLFTSGHAPAAWLLDMDGRPLHEWRYEFRDAWPDSPIHKDVDMMHWWRRVHLFENGDLLVIFGGLGILKLDRDSHLLWANPVLAHHHFVVQEDGTILVLTREVVQLPAGPGIDDFLTTLDPDGVQTDRLSLHEALKAGGVLPRMRRRFRESYDRHDGDLFHANTLQILDGRHADLDPAFRAGNVLVSLRNPSLLVVVDPQAREAVWSMTGDFRLQHEAQLLDGGGLLLFDNCGLPGERSRILELDPQSGATLWSYTGTAAEPFYTRTCGAVRRLANGDTLVTESENGRAFEVTADGEIVWEFYNPNVIEGGRFIAILPEVERIPVEFTASWLDPDHGLR